MRYKIVILIEIVTSLVRYSQEGTQNIVWVARLPLGEGMHMEEQATGNSSPASNVPKSF